MTQTLAPISKISVDDYFSLHTAPLVPLNIKVDKELFLSTMEKYFYAFRRWGVTHYEYNRYGLPLVNHNGDLHNNIELGCWALDQWNKDLPRDKMIIDHHFTKPTPALFEKCFDVLNPIKPFMLRSTILKWMNGTRFFPHTDTKKGMPARNIRLWGTLSPESTILRFDKNHTRCDPREFKHYKNNAELIQYPVEIEAGRLYIIDSGIIHDGISTADNVYQFFIALDAKKSYNTLKELIYSYK